MFKKLKGIQIGCYVKSLYLHNYKYTKVIKIDGDEIYGHWSKTLEDHKKGIYYDNKLTWSYKKNLEII